MIQSSSCTEQNETKIQDKSEKNLKGNDPTSPEKRMTTINVTDLTVKEIEVAVELERCKINIISRLHRNHRSSSLEKRVLEGWIEGPRTNLENGGQVPLSAH